MSLPEEFIETAAAREWELPPLDDVADRVPDVLRYVLTRRDEEARGRIAAKMSGARAGIDYSVWLRWAKELPEGPAAQSDLERSEVQRFVLVLQIRWEDDHEEEEIEAFESQVWDKVAEQYGGTIRCDSGEELTAGIAVEHSATVLSLVLEGIKQYKLMDRVKLIWSVPDPEDWHRDRDVIVWPLDGCTEP